MPLWTVALGAAVFVVSFLVGRRAAGARGPLGVILAGAVVGVVTGSAWDVAVMLGAAVVLPWTLGRSVRQQADLVTVAAERARLRERDRIAHDMHDTLGHELGLLALRAGALELSADLDQRHRDAAAELRIGAGQATERLAEIVAMLRDGEPAPLDPPAGRVEDVVERALRAGMAATLEWDGPRQLPAGVERVAYHVVREALTNAAKHAPGTEVAVRVTTVDRSTTLTVSNPLTTGARRRGAGGRVGLEGLRVRVRLAGGTLHFGPDGRVFRLAATLPHGEAA